MTASMSDLRATDQCPVWAVDLSLGWATIWVQWATVQCPVAEELLSPTVPLTPALFLSVCSALLLMQSSVCSLLPNTPQTTGSGMQCLWNTCDSPLRTFVSSFTVIFHSFWMLLVATYNKLGVLCSIILSYSKCLLSIDFSSMPLQLF